MCEQLQRYFAALVGCAITATWVAAGFGAALAAVIVSAAAYGAVALSQRRSLLESRRGRTVARTHVAAARRPAPDPARRSGRRARPAAPHRRPSPAREWPVFDLDEEPDEPSISAAGRYGW